MKTILVTGVNGQVGFELSQSLAPLGRLILLNRNDLDLSDASAILEVLNQFKPDVIVNPAAYTAVDKAESDQDTTFAINAIAPKIMAEWAVQNNALLVHYSTDYVFDGNGVDAYLETDETNPQSVYGASKLQGEQAILASNAKHIILRTSWVYGAHGNNFIKTILRLAQQRDALSVVGDQAGTPTGAKLLADVTATILNKYFAVDTHAQAELLGLYHLTAKGVTTWYDYAVYFLNEAVAQGVALTVFVDALQKIPSSSYPTPAKRPTNSQLNCGKIERTFGLTLPDWRQGVKEVLLKLV